MHRSAVLRPGDCAARAGTLGGIEYAVAHARTCRRQCRETNDGKCCGSVSRRRRASPRSSGSNSRFIDRVARQYDRFAGARRHRVWRRRSAINERVLPPHAKRTAEVVHQCALLRNPAATGEIRLRRRNRRRRRPLPALFGGLLCVVDSRFSTPKKTWQFLEQASMQMDCDQRRNDTQMLVAATANSTGVPGSRVISLPRTGREIPSFFILAINVVRLSPSRAAAPSGPPIIQPAACSVLRIRARVESLNVSCVGLIVSVTGFLSDIAKGFRSTPLLERITARSIRF